MTLEMVEVTTPRENAENSVVGIEVRTQLGALRG